MSQILKNSLVVVIVFIIFSMLASSIQAKSLDNLNVYVWDFKAAAGQEENPIVKIFTQNLPNLFVNELKQRNCFHAILERQNLDTLLSHKANEKQIIEIIESSSSNPEKDRTIEADAVIFVEIADDDIKYMRVTANTEGFDGTIISHAIVTIEKSKGLDVDLWQKKMQVLAQKICDNSASMVY